MSTAGRRDKGPYQRCYFNPP